MSGEQGRFTVLTHTLQCVQNDGSTSIVIKQIRRVLQGLPLTVGPDRINIERWAAEPMMFAINRAFLVAM